MVAIVLEKGANSPRSPPGNHLTASNCKRRDSFTSRYSGTRFLALLTVLATFPLLSLFVSDADSTFRQSRVLLAADHEPIPADDNAVIPAHERVKEEAIRKRSTGLRRRKKSAVVFICNAKYCPAVASSIHSLRSDGGFEQDVIVILDESNDYAVVNLKKDLELSNSSMTKRERRRTRIYVAQHLFDTLLANQTSAVQKYREPPPMASCIDSDHRKNGHRTYYLKTLIFHPVITAKYDRVLCIDACMTFHLPRVQRILDLPEAEGALLAAPDPWRWQKRGIGRRALPCADQQAVKTVRNIVGKRMIKAGYFNTAFILFDTAIVNNYMGEFGSTGSSLLELLTVYHSMTPAWQGNQDIFSTYWVYMRKLYRALPHSILGSPLIPYDFIRQIPKGKYIISAGNLDREVCNSRPTNKLTVAEE